MADKASGELKKRAWLAKQRLKMGYWERARQGETVGSERAAHKAELMQSGASADDKMYKKVCDMLDRDDTIINPIGQLIDSELYSSLDPMSKQRYILELSNKFRELKERYYKERSGTGA